MRSLAREVLYSIRRLAFRPAHTLLITLTLALGIGANTAVFSVVDSTLLRPAPFAYANRLVDVLDQNRRASGGGNTLTPPKILGWQQQAALFERFEAYAPAQFDVTGAGEPERLRGLTVTTGLFSMLDARPRLGRAFTSADGRPGSERVAIISESLWSRRFAASPDALGQRTRLNDEDYTVIGVMPRRFRLLQEEEAVWLPFSLDAHLSDTTVRGFYGLARLARGVAVTDAQKIADGIADRLQKESPLARSWDLQLEKKRVARVDPTTRTALFVLLGAVTFVLLMTCANVASLLLAQAPARQREMAIRSALGAGRGRLFRSVLWETLLLAASGGWLGVLLARWGVDALLAAAPERLTYMNTTTIEVDTRVVAVMAFVTLLTGLLFGVVPALRGSRPDLRRSLHGTDRPLARSFGRLPGGLVVFEVGAAVILLIGSALMSRTLLRLEAIDPGFDPAGLLAMHVDLPSDRYATTASRLAFFDALSARLKAVPGIDATTVAYGVPPSLGGFTSGKPEVEREAAALPRLIMPFNMVTPTYFETLRIPILAGRNFTERDAPDATIVSKGLADRFWPDGNAVGHRFRVGSGPWKTVVGVVANVEARAAGEDRTTLQLYYPWVSAGQPASSGTSTGGAQTPRRTYDWRLLIVRARDPRAAVPQIKAVIASLDPGQPVEQMSLVKDIYAEAFARQRFVLIVLGTFAALSLALAAAGIFGVLSQAVAQRTREIGIRMALGATPGDVLRLFLSRGMALATTGAALGMVSALGFSNVLRNLLFEVGPRDPISFAAVATVLCLVALVACWLPTRRAMRVDPAIALRAE